jgi:hypothetical protein
VTKTSKQLRALVREEESEGKRLDLRYGDTKWNAELKRIMETGVRKNKWVRTADEETSTVLDIPAFMCAVVCSSFKNTLSSFMQSHTVSVFIDCMKVSCCGVCS